MKGAEEGREKDTRRNKVRYEGREGGMYSRNNS